MFRDGCPEVPRPGNAVLERDYTFQHREGQAFFGGAQKKTAEAVFSKIDPDVREARTGAPSVGRAGDGR